MLALAFELLAGNEELGPSGSAPSRRRIVLSARLVAGLRTRDRAAFEELFQVAFAPLVALAASIVGSADAAEDVVQDVMLWLWDHGDTWTPGPSPAAYIIGAVRHRALSAVRVGATELRYRDQLTAEEKARSIPATDWAAEQRDLESVLQRAVASLTERQRTALLLRAEQHLSIPEIAAALGVGVRGAEKLVSRAMRTVRDALREATEGK